MYEPGDHFVICDLSGRKSLRSECVKTWDGFIVRKELADGRHPLDTQKPPMAERSVRDSRTVNDVFLEYGDVTADDL